MHDKQHAGDLAPEEQSEEEELVRLYEETILVRAQELWGENGGEIGLAHEGMEIDLR